jgi:hypothetical protein
VAFGIIETVPDLKGFAVANGHFGKGDDEVRCEANLVEFLKLRENMKPHMTDLINLRHL